jgi:hypothetical protein
VLAARARRREGGGYWIRGRAAFATLIGAIGTRLFTRRVEKKYIYAVLLPVE